MTGERPAAAMLFREASIQGRLVNLRAADDLGRYVTLVSGRLPTVCVPSHCEVLRLQGTGPIPSTPQLRPDRGRPRGAEAGRAVRAVRPAGAADRDGRAGRPLPHAAALADRDRERRRRALAQHRARDVLSLVRVVRPDRAAATCIPWAIDAFREKVQRLTAQIEASSDEFQVTAPTDELATAASSSTAAARRLLLLGGEGGALLLAFTILAAAALRRDVTDARRRLVWFGARRWQVELHTLAESLALAAAGTVVGWVVGGGVAAVVAGRAGSPAGDVVEHALLSRGGLLAAARRRRHRGAAALRDCARAGRAASDGSP